MSDDGRERALQNRTQGQSRVKPSLAAWMLFYRRQSAAAAADSRKSVSLFDTVAEATFADENAAAPSGHEGATPTLSTTSSDPRLGLCFSSVAVEQQQRRL